MVPTSMTTKAFSLTLKQGRYLLPALRRKILIRRFKDHPDQYSMIGTEDCFKDAMRRCAYLD